MITEDIPKDEYARTYPNSAPITTLQSLGVGDQNLSQWLTEDTVRVADYYYLDYTKETLNLYPGNVTAFEGTPEDKQLKELYGKPKKSRKSDRVQVKYCKINGYEILEERDWAGKYIPVVRIVGNEFEVDGRLYVSGLVRNAKDAQRMYNYWVSQEAEMLALAPKAPFIGYGGQFEGYENQWKTANTTNWPYLEVNPDVTDGAGSVLPLPQRAQPPMASSGLLQAKAGASEDIKASTGQYDASLGMKSNERSGKAILARQREGDVGTYHYGDNLARGVRHIVRQLVDLIPKIYDTQRVARIIGVDGETKMVKLNPDQPEAVRKITDQQPRCGDRQDLQPQRRQVRCGGGHRPRLRDQTPRGLGSNGSTVAGQPTTVGGRRRLVCQEHGLARRSRDGQAVCQNHRPQTYGRRRQAARSCKPQNSKFKQWAKSLTNCMECCKTWASPSKRKTCTAKILRLKSRPLTQKPSVCKLLKRACRLSKFKTSCWAPCTA